MGNNKNDFVLDSKGRCFLCLRLDKTMTVKHEQAAVAPLYPKSSIYYLSRYLKMDLRKVFRDSEQIPPHLLAKVQSSRLKVELCEECVRLNEQFSNIYRKLEKVEIELGSCLRRIHAKFLDESVAGKQEGEFKKLTNMEPQLQLSSGGELEILEVLREEAFQKSHHHKLRADVPAVKLVNLTRKEIEAEKSKFPNANRAQKTSLDQTANILTPPELAGGSSNSDLKRSEINIKSETIDFPYDDDGNYPSDDFNEPNEAEATCEDFEDTTLTMEVESSNAGGDSSVVVCSSSKMYNVRKRAARFGTGIKVPKCNSNSETGKFGCPTCSIEFSSELGFKRHYLSVHLKVRFKCVTCGKQFAQQSTCNRHQKTAHVGVRYACQVCNKSFKHTYIVRQHQRKTDCGKKMALKSTASKTY